LTSACTVNTERGIDLAVRIKGPEMRRQTLLF
jgi:hypothetical protein